MKRFKGFGLFVLAVALTVFASSASADYVTTTTGGKPETSTFHLVNEGGHIVLQNGLSNISCASTASGHIESSGAAVFSHLTFTNCTNSWHVTGETVNGPAYGAFWVDHTSGHDGTVSSMWVRINATRFGIECVYETFLTHLGTLTGGDPATLDLEASIPIDEAASSILCGSGSSKWEGNYVTTSALYVEDS